MENFEKLIQVVESAKLDYEKFKTKRNKKASVRLRKALIYIKNLAHDARKDVLDQRKD